MGKSFEEIARESRANEERLEHAKLTWAVIPLVRLRAILLQGFGRWCDRFPNDTSCRLCDVVRSVKEDIQAAVPVPLHTQWDDMPFQHQHEEPLAGFVEVVWQLVRAGLVIPARQKESGEILFVRVTPRGRSVFTQGDHPLAPGFMSRIHGRCPGLPDEVSEHLQDAVDCMERDLLRPAVIMTGLAYEKAIETIGLRLDQNQHIANNRFEKERKAALRIELIKNAINTLALAPEEKFQAQRALGYADLLRDRRNDGGHTKPRWPFDDRSEVDSLIEQAGMHLPALWLLYSKA